MIVLLLLLLPTISEARSVSYAIFGTPTENSVPVTINTILDRTTYTCELASYVCTETKKTINPTLENPLTARTVADIAKERTEKSIATTTVSKGPTPYVPLYPQFMYPKEARMLTLSPNKEKLAYFISENTPIKKTHSYMVVDANGKTLEKFGLTPGWELVTDNGKLFDWTFDSSTLVYLDDRSGYQSLYMVDMTKNPQNLVGTPLITKKYTVLDFVVVDQTVYFIANRANRFTWGLFAIDLNTQKLTVIEPSVLYTNGLFSVGHKILFTKTVDGAGVPYVYNTVDKKIHSFSGIPKESVSVVPSTIIDTQAVKGILMQPKTASSTAIIWLHGGPYRQAALGRHSYGSYATYDWILDTMVEHGVTVLKLEYPGSLGFGTTYTRSILGNVGKSDVKAVEKAVALLKKKGIKNIYVFGNSYGGYLSLKSTVELGSIRGGIAVAPVTDWKKLITDMSGSLFEVYFNGRPNKDNEKLYATADVLEKMKVIKKPIALFHGGLDTQVPYAQSDYIREKTDNPFVSYTRIENQGHVISGVSQNEALCGAVASFVGVTSTSTDFCKMQ